MRSFLQFGLFLVLVVVASTKPQVKNVHGSFTLLATTLAKSYYISQDSAYFEAADWSCKESLGGRLASIETQQEKNDIREALQGFAIGGIWVGGLVDTTRPYCADNIIFNKICWVWNHFDTSIDETVIPWDSGVVNKIQNHWHRTFLQTAGLSLNIEENTSIFIYLCETPMEPLYYYNPK